MAKVKVEEPKKEVKKVVLISAHAKATRKEGEKWTDCIKRASLELRSQGKI